MRYGTTPHSIVCLSSQVWEEPMWTNKQHIMSRLATEHDVLHVDFGLPTFWRYAKERLTHSPGDLAHPLRVLTDGTYPHPDGLHVGNHYVPRPVRWLPRGHNVRDFCQYDLKVMLQQRYISRLKAPPIVWVYHPGYGDAVDRIGKKLLVYDCVDNYQAFPEYKHTPWLMQREQRLCQKADVVVTTSQRLYELRSPYNPERTFLVHNVGDADHFQKTQDPQTRVVPQMQELSGRGPVVGFVGAVSDYKLNLDWLMHAARQRPLWQFALIGPVGIADASTDVSTLGSMPNVHLFGAQPYASLPNWLAGADITVIPYRLNTYTESVFPIKFFEFLATGKPVVISPLPAVKAFWGAVHVAENAQDFVHKCELALAESPTDPAVASRLKLAQENSWPQRISTIMEHVERAL